MTGWDRKFRQAGGQHPDTPRAQSRGTPASGVYPHWNVSPRGQGSMSLPGGWLGSWHTVGTGQMRARQARHSPAGPGALPRLQVSGPRVCDWRAWTPRFCLMVGFLGPLLPSRSGSCDCCIREHCRVASFPATPGNWWGTPWNPEKQWSPAWSPKEGTKALQATWKREEGLDARNQQNRVTPAPPALRLV